MHRGVEGLDAAAKDFREAGRGRHVGDGQARRPQGRGRSAGGKEFGAGGHQPAGEVGDAGLVGYAEKGAMDFHGPGL